MTVYQGQSISTFSATHMNFIAGRQLVNELSFYFSSGSYCVDVKCCEHPSLMKSLICNVVLNSSDVNKNCPI